MTYAFNMKVSELCIMASFDIQYILDLQIRIHVNNCIMHENNFVRSDRWWSAQ